jgi:hypothetical protein
MRVENEIRNRCQIGLSLLLGLIAALGFIWSVADAKAFELRQSGTIQVSQVQIAFLYSGNIGGGTLIYGGRKYAFDIGGLGIGGIGASKIKATGEVYNLDNLSDFEGAYVQARYGAVIREKSAGELWLKNPFGVFLRLDAKREGLALSLGADAVYIRFD